MGTPEDELYARLKSLEGIKETAPSSGSDVEKGMEKTDTDFKVPVTLRNLFTHQDAHPIVLDLSLLKAFGAEWLGWEAETVWASIHGTFESKVSEHTRAKIHAVQTLHIVSSPWESWQVFEKITQAVNSSIPRFDIVQAPSLEQLYAAVDMMESFRAGHPFSDEVKAYMAAAVLNEEVLYVAPPLDFIQLEVSQPRYRCVDCGMTYNATYHDGFCDVCTQKFDPENGLSMKPDPELVKAGRGKLKIQMSYNPDPVEKKWKEVSSKKTSDIDLEENQVDIQVAKLLIARDYMNVRRRQLAEQLVSLKSWLRAK